MKNKVLVVGAGGAGLVAAINAHDNGSDVTILTKDYPTRSQTSMAQGGINAVLKHSENDSVEEHIANTLKSAAGIANEDEVTKMCSEAPNALEWLDNIGVQFSRTSDGKIAHRRLGGATGDRACYAQDYTGLKILHTLYDQVLKRGIEIKNDMFLLDILTTENKVSGVSVLNKRNGEIEIYEAPAVILATGGYARIYDKHSTNAVGTSGDGLAAAIRAGARVSDMEFVQFHPTALKNSSILISESARGAGGYLLNSKGERFVDELLPRDKVALAIHEEIAKGEDIFLDIRHLGEEFIDHELPQERKLAKLYENVDPVNDLIPIKPVAHYTMGGIEVSKDSQTIVSGLFACGECANHRVHGANRLGGNSLLELVVFGKEAGISASKFAQNTDDIKAASLDSNILDEISEYTNEIDFYELRESMGNMFYKNVGISRDKEALQESLNTVKEYLSKLPLMGVQDKSKIYNTNLIEFLEFKNMLELSRLVLKGALDREESRGAHFRSDYPVIDEAYSKHTIVDINGVVAS
ncbi:FAD-dependent oxidoreductase [Sulfurimonas sp.]|uniref:FAD-dependent oxidoreductase n=1 Tax=Sulfurimonas sp. TaxID=2022749 RepID=UPI00356825A2